MLLSIYDDIKLFYWIKRFVIFMAIHYYRSQHQGIGLCFPAPRHHSPVCLGVLTADGCPHHEVQGGGSTKLHRQTPRQDGAGIQPCPLYVLSDWTSCSQNYLAEGWQGHHKQHKLLHLGETLSNL